MTLSAAEPVDGSSDASTSSATSASDPSRYVRERHNDGKRDVRWPAAPEPLAVPVYDNHAHLEIADGDEPLGLAEQLERAAAVGVVGVVQAGGDIESSVWSAGPRHPTRAFSRPSRSTRTRRPRTPGRRRAG